MYEDMDWEKKQTLLTRIGFMYRNCEIQMRLHGGFVVEESSALYKYLEVKSSVDLALKKMTYEEIRIIKNEYLKNTRENWYLAFYHEEEYHMLLQTVANTFLGCLYG
ncbi:MAG: MG284/MPN403 family protein [Breznakia sp.]